jgi:1-deoxy-D-xylulose-5-phosphate synthase
LIPIGKAEVLKHGKDISIWAIGNMIPMAKEVAAELEKKGYEVSIINPRSVKPLDVGTLEFFARSADLIITMEDHVLKGGFGSIVLEELSERGLATPVVRIGWPDQFVDHGKQDKLREKYGMTVKATLEKVQPYLKKKPVTSASAA